MDPVAKKKIKKAFIRRDFNLCINLFKKFFDDSTLDSNTSCIVGLSYLYKFRLDLAKKYLKYAIELDQTNITAIMGIAAIKLRENDLSGSTELYLKVLDIDSNNKFASKILNRLKSCDNLDKLIRKMRLKDYVPIPPVYISFLSIFTLVMVISVFIVLIILFIINVV